MKKPNPSEKKDNDSKKTKGEPEGYPLYPPKDDIYKRSHEEKDIDPDDGSPMEEDDEDTRIESSDELDFDDDIEEGELDIPGSELDDEMEDIGEEDEENNYYSIGGDKHSDLDENNETEDDIII